MLSSGLGVKRRCAVLGSPIGHSLSPVLHRAAYDVLGIDWSYDAVEVTEDQLAAFLDGLEPQWRGLSLTMPLKRTVMTLVDELDEAARVTGVANTVVLADGRRRAANTDVSGAVAALRERGMDEIASVVVLGGGATAASVLVATAELGCREVTLLVRDPARAAETTAVVEALPAAPRVRVQPLGSPAEADLLVSTIPAGAQTAAVVDAVTAPAVFEVRYDPWPTPVVVAAREAGATVVGGLDLLVHQAVDQVRLMTGVHDVPLAAMRAAGETELAARASA